MENTLYKLRIEWWLTWRAFVHPRCVQCQLPSSSSSDFSFLGLLGHSSFFFCDSLRVLDDVFFNIICPFKSYCFVHSVLQFLFCSPEFSSSCSLLPYLRKPLYAAKDQRWFWFQQRSWWVSKDLTYPLFVCKSSFTASFNMLTEKECWHPGDTTLQIIGSDYYQFVEC